jgi:ribosome-binding protein aMBF1 (putative translation factor)
LKKEGKGKARLRHPEKLKKDQDVSIEGRKNEMFGEFIKERRVAKGISLREFCKRMETDASNWSKVERGLLAPPRMKKD